MGEFVKITVIVLFLSVFTCVALFAQREPVWDNTAKNDWSADFEKVSILSTADSSMQQAYLYKTKSRTPKPLIVSLHTWSGNYAQYDPIVKEVLARDWNYIHPDFRGANNTPEALGSALVISDIEDAIRYALKHTNADSNDVHIIGVSGGGYATLLAYMNIAYPVKSFSAWAPISDIEAWYWESVGRNQKYAGDILKAVSPDAVFDNKEAARRSPLVHTFPKEKRKEAKLYIYEGIHDGYTGSVPITHAINMYNRLVGELKYDIIDLDGIMLKAIADPDLVSSMEIIDLLTKRVGKYDKRKMLFGRPVYLFREYGNIQLTVFEGGHEQLPQALGLLPYNRPVPLKCNILTLGDSNGQSRHGWVEQLKKMLPQSKIVNISKSGRTIGFDNGGREDLNALKGIDSYLDAAQGQVVNDKYDYIIVCLGTNDNKRDFASRQDEVLPNFKKLLGKIKNHKLIRKSKPKLICVTPPPIVDIQGKFSGGSERLAQLMPGLVKIASAKGFEVIDVYHPLLGVFDYYAADGIHMAAPGQEIVAQQILDGILKHEKQK